METSSSYLSNESGATIQKDNKTVTLGLLLRIIGKVLLAGFGFLIGCFLGLVVALSTGLIQFVGC